MANIDGNSLLTLAYFKVCQAQLRCLYRAILVSGLTTLFCLIFLTNGIFWEPEQVKTCFSGAGTISC